MRLSDFSYELPDELIAHEPAVERGASRLMVLERGQDTPPQHHIFHDLPSFLREGDLLVMNDTRVFRARLFVKKPSGGRVELLFLQPEKDQEGQVWRAMARSSRPIRAGMELVFPEDHGAHVIGRAEDGAILLRVPEQLDLFGLLERHGEVPLPPYIDPQRASVDHTARYQTVYAKEAGAVAAPTAGLHFSQELLDELASKGVGLSWVTLHVGAGTFLPVRVENILEHQMHTERYQISEGTAQAWEATKAAGGRVIAVGTTSLRALEASAQAFGKVCAGSGETDIFIYPGFAFRAVDAMITNFHLPESTLLMLVSAFHGRDRTLQAYEEAVKQGYHFYSYGDAMLIR
ncbi:MAG: tRNA preQ1(34) S-adenosylmethionine ribosyltransferase-isomerase QueA [Myxococcales bacterium]|nr:tRNA preQ1(34) S-adenosylmethionine ribosyltransferase-isomerase QueA [Myxococcales bacterium]